jgi:SWI/SNF-related matrix-associated actin-dependent regulator of chromatin subfamily A3
MLDKIEDALELASIRYERLDGTMRREERVHAMDTLKADPSCEILLVSLKAGGVGLNLTSASRVYLMDPYWNPAVEHQAVDRVVSCPPWRRGVQC